MDYVHWFVETGLCELSILIFVMAEAVLGGFMLYLMIKDRQFKKTKYLRYKAKRIIRKALND